MTPDFKDASVLRSHVQHTMDFYHPRCIDPSGGFYHYFKDDGTVYNHADRHLVSSTRFIFNYAMAFRHFRRPEYLEGVRHGLQFLRDVHRQPAAGGYAWEIRWENDTASVVDGTNHCYGLAFVLLACAQAVMASVDEAREHYRSDWSVDWDYHKGEKSNLFRPWGFQPGHLTEWAKLLLILERYRGQLAGDGNWLAPRAQALFDAALVNAWDHEHGGIHYGFAPDGAICDADKYFWVQAESLAAAALLANRTGDAKYWDWYARLWRYSWKHFVDQRHGAWFRILTADNRKISDEKSPAGKTDYHTMGACYEVLSLLKD